jgi:hypothetical protein
MTRRRLAAGAALLVAAFSVTSAASLAVLALAGAAFAIHAPLSRAARPRRAVLFSTQARAAARPSASGSPTRRGRAGSRRSS